MSSLFSRPKMPSQPFLPYTPIPATSTAKTDTQDNTASTKESENDKERINQILSRHRGRSGTIGTSLRGALNDVLDTNGQPTRKTLLGD